MRAAVIGAGLAGLSAADELRRGGAETVVLEARDRVGGRVWSRRLPNGAVVEMGAEFLLPGNTEVRELAGRLGLGLWDKRMRYGRREPRGGTPTTHEQMAAAADRLGPALAASPAGRTARELLDGLDVPDGAREALAARVEISSANSAELVAAGDLAGIAHVDDEPAPSVAGGNQGLAFGLAATLGDSVRLRSPVERVDWDPGGGVRVQIAGAELEADVCVVAVPASVLHRIVFEPALPEPLAATLAGVRYGEAAKLFVPLTAPAPAGAVMCVPERWWCWTAGGEGGEVQPLVSAFAGSPAALRGLRVEEGPETWLAALERLRPDLRLAPAQALLSTWSDDPWALAAYSTSPAPELALISKRPVGPLAFAGEHLGGEFAALMEGALRSGRSAAEGLLAGAAGPSGAGG